MTRAKTFTILQATFRAWRGQDRGSEVKSSIKLHDHAMAATAQKLTKLSRRVSTAVRAEDADFYQRLADEAGPTYTHEGLAGLWNKLKATLLKKRPKTLQFDMTSKMRCFIILSNCKQVVLSWRIRRPSMQFFDIMELPTLYEIEGMCLRQKPHKAPGPDGIPPEFCRISAPTIAPGLHNVLLKSVLSSTEPCRFKGGNP